MKVYLKIFTLMTEKITFFFCFLGVKMNQCEQCQKCFTSAIALKNHINNVHEGQRNFRCELCGKGFHNPHYVKHHIETVHQGNRNYNCEFCGKLKCLLH